MATCSTAMRMPRSPTSRCSTPRAEGPTASRTRRCIRSISPGRTRRPGNPTLRGLPGSRRSRPDGRRAQRRRDPGVESTRPMRDDCLLVVTGLAMEASGLLRRLPPAVRRELTVRTVGPRAAMLDRLELPRLLREPAALIVTGFSGGCGPDLRPGDVVVGDPVAG